MTQSKIGIPKNVGFSEKNNFLSKGGFQTSVRSYHYLCLVDLVEMGKYNTLVYEIKGIEISNQALSNTPMLNVALEGVNT